MITLSTLPLATAQEVYNQVKSHMLSQNEQSRLQDGICAYRGKDGLKCAAGCLISDQEYEKDFDEVYGSWNEMVERGIAPEEHQELILKLQELHDGIAPYLWPKYFEDIEKQFNLQP